MTSPALSMPLSLLSPVTLLLLSATSTLPHRPAPTTTSLSDCPEISAIWRLEALQVHRSHLTPITIHTPTPARNMAVLRPLRPLPVHTAALCLPSRRLC